MDMGQEGQERTLSAPNDMGVVRTAPNDSGPSAARRARLIDGDAAEAFCRERAERMKSPMGAAIYAGLADRIKRGFFAPEGSGK
ncbi:hypothetical protein [Microbacterium soli]|uniref:Uncharacterized protein n=1 Tax=Microbacterium soli TaxID=446075 RepID=A0ABP7NIW5_9MICO